MILSVSRRTDIPGCYPEWFMNRLRDKYVMTRNPMNFHQVSQINLSPDFIECIVFGLKMQYHYGLFRGIKSYGIYVYVPVHHYPIR